ncbi:WXG100 family type VII secretion target [Streptomyces sp. 2A115]|uniref:WXG100 family type VII secretion target n=1 Tax=Streptomyces sp. 2A115 TaxID=3457439 RepID=UPI003FD4923D
MADGSHKTMSPGEFEVALGQLGDATGKVRGISGNIQGDLGQIRTEFARLPEAWRSPSESSSEPVMKWFDRVSADLHALLEETVRRMQVSYDNYLDAEKKNFHNSGGGSGGSHVPPNRYAQNHQAPAHRPEASLPGRQTDPHPEATLRDRPMEPGGPDA